MRMAYDKIKILHENHWVDDTFKQRMTTRCWKLILLNNDDKITFHGHITQLVAKKMGYGVVEISKSLKQELKGETG